MIKSHKILRTAQIFSISDQLLLQENTFTENRQ